jgi:hypothetical protein
MTKGSDASTFHGAVLILTRLSVHSREVSALLAIPGGRLDRSSLDRGVA